MEEGGFLTIKSPDFGITYEGRLGKEPSEIKGTFTLGPFELPLSFGAHRQRMKPFRFTVALLIFGLTGFARRNRCFAEIRRIPAFIRARRRVSFIGSNGIPDRRSNRFFAGLERWRRLFRRRRRKHLCGRCRDRASALETHHWRPGASTPAVIDGTVYAVSYDGKLYASMPAPAGPMEIRDGRRTPFRSERHSWFAAEKPDDR